PIYINQNFGRKSWKSPPSVVALSNGARELMIVLPISDPGRAWQTNNFGDKDSSFPLVADIFQYAVDKKNLRYKGDTYLVYTDKSIAAERTMKLARLQYNGNWDP